MFIQDVIKKIWEPVSKEYKDGYQESKKLSAGRII